MVTDLTKGSVTKKLVLFSVPLLISVAFQQLYNMVDSVVVGKYCGTNELAAVGASFPITMLFVAIASGASVGASVVVSKIFGERDEPRLKTAITTSVILSLALSAVLTAVGIIYCDPILEILNTKPEIFADSSVYMQIYIWGLGFVFIYNMCNGIFTALGDSVTPLALLIGSSLFNIVLDVIFVKNLGLAVKGVAAATFIAQGISSLVALILLFYRLSKMGVLGQGRVFSVRMLGSVSRLAVPSVLQQSFVSVGNLLIQYLVNGFDANTVAGFSAAIKLNGFALTAFIALSNGLSSFTAQNIGARQTARVKRGYKAGLIMAASIAVPFALVFALLGKYLMLMFVSADETAVIETGSRFLLYVSPFYIIVALKLITDSVLRGAGYIFGFVATTFSDLIIRVAISFVLVEMLDSVVGIYISWPIGWIISAVMSVLFYRFGGWRKKLA
ncbi:MAG: MATE family efflux transporter [Oscillospiraceae bacterium]